MRTTLDIDDDVLAATRELARQQNLSAGRVVSRLLRQALGGNASKRADGESAVAGFRPLPSRGGVIGNELVDTLRDSEGL